MKIQSPGAATGIIEMSWPAGERAEARPLRADADELVRHRAQNARTWAALERLGVQQGDELVLDFVFASGGFDADRILARYLGSRRGYLAEVEKDGVSGHTAPMPMGLEALDRWVAAMLDAGSGHGGCAFRGWTATIRRP